MDTALLISLWPFLIAVVLEFVKQAPPVRQSQAFQDWLFAVPAVVGAVTGPFFAPVALELLGASIEPGVVPSVLIGIGAGWCSQGIFETYKARFRDWLSARHRDGD